MPSLSPPLRLAFPLRYLTRGSLHGGVVLHLSSVLLFLSMSFARFLTVPRYFSPSLRLSSLLAPFSLFLSRAKVEPNRGYANDRGVWGDFTSRISASEGHWGRDKVVLTCHDRAVHWRHDKPHRQRADIFPLAVGTKSSD